MDKPFPGWSFQAPKHTMHGEERAGVGEVHETIQSQAF